jgi:hypothetical protein
MKKKFFPLFICLFFFSNINAKNYNYDDSMNCDEIALDFYYDTLREGGSQQEATDMYMQSHDICYRHYYGSSEFETVLDKN